MLPKIFRQRKKRSMILCLLALCIGLSVILPVQDTAAVTPGVVAGGDYYLMNASTGNLIVRSMIPGQALQCGVRGSMNASDRTWHITHKSGTTQYYYFKTPDAYVTGTQRNIYIGYNSGQIITAYADMSNVTRYFWVARSSSSLYQGCYLITIAINGVTNYVCETTDHILGLTTTLSAACYWSLVPVSGSANICSEFSCMWENGAINTMSDNELFVNIMSNRGRDAYAHVGLTPTATESYLSAGTVFVFASHGQASAIRCQANSTGETLGWLAVNAAAARSAADAWNMTDAEFSALTNRYIANASSNAFAHEQCVLYLSCDAGVSYNGANLVTETYNKGAHFVLGYNGTVFQIPTMHFLSDFLYACNGYQNLNGTTSYIGVKNIADSISRALANSSDDFPTLVTTGDAHQYIEN